MKRWIMPETPPIKDPHVCVTHQILSPTITFWLTLTDVFLLDALFKWLVSAKPQGYMVTLIPRVIDLFHAENSGVAFGLFGEGAQASLPIIVSGALIALLIYLVVRYPMTSTTQALGYGFLLGGGLNNWADRLFTGQVTDYFYLTFINFPIFNLSDVLIFVGSLMVMFHTLKTLPKEPSPHA
jgi:signal peptidase II